MPRSGAGGGADGSLLILSLLGVLGLAALALPRLRRP
jgi:hypothetical protein